MTNKEFRELNEKVMNGDYEAYYEAKKLFAFEPKQEKLLTDIINNTIL